MIEMPPVLYKYCTAKTGLRILKTNKIRFTPPTEFNDPFDVNPAHDLSDAALLPAAQKQAEIDCIFAAPRLPGHEYLRQVKLRQGELMKSATSRRPRLKEDVAHLYQKGYSELFGVCCLTEHKSDLPMWAHYADEHKGCVVELTIRSEPYVERRSLKVVTYSETRPIQSYTGHAFELVYVKSLHWRNENEWRMVAAFDDLEHSAGGMPSIYLDALNAGTITGVYLGCRMPETQVKEFQQAARMVNLPGRRLFKMRPDTDKFHLNAEIVSF